MTDNPPLKVEITAGGEQCKAPAIKGGDVRHLMECPDRMEMAALTRHDAVCKECRRARARAACWRKKGAS